jgi:flavin reductase (DIM6/NTAB) family NADH-FMN oxidoreductase RutF
MELDIATLERRDIYKVMTGCIVPRPIAWVSTQDSAGINNLAPFSFFNGISSNPPALCFSIAHNSQRTSGQKDTLHNILEMGEFVVNVVDEATAEAMDATAADFPADVDEFAAVGVTPAPSQSVRPPRVAESPACFECTLHTTVQVGEGSGSSTLVIGIIKHIYVRDDVIGERNYIDNARLKPVGRLAGKSYCYVRDLFEISKK